LSFAKKRLKKILFFLPRKLRRKVRALQDEKENVVQNPGANVIIAFSGDFSHFGAKKWRFPNF
jgi:hypothetical protein